MKVGELYAKKAIAKISGATLREINKKIGIKLLTKAGQKGVVNLTRIVPGVSGLIGGTIDAATTRLVGLAAKKAFGSKNNAESDTTA